MASKKIVFIAACLGMLLFGIGLITLGSVATGLQRSFGLDNVSSGALFSILPVGIIGGSLLFGPFSDRYGYKPFLLLSCFCMFAGFQGIAYASSLEVLKVCIFLFGFGGGALNGSANAIVSDISETNKGANLSLLGVFFAIGALGMPVILGVLQKYFSYQQIVSSVGYLTLLAALLFMITRFPAPKHEQGIPFSKGIVLLKDNVLLLISTFLFCQCAFEAIINNWTTTYLLDQLSIPGDKALFALSSYVTGMAVMRVILGSMLRKSSPEFILSLSFGLLLLGCALLKFSSSYSGAVAGLVSLGAGLAAGFPVMLGFVGNRYTSLSGTAFSLVISIGLIGNMAVNYLMGLIAERYGIHHLITLGFTLSVLMFLLSITVVRKILIQPL